MNYKETLNQLVEVRREIAQMIEPVHNHDEGVISCTVIDEDSFRFPTCCVLDNLKRSLNHDPRNVIKLTIP